MSGRSVSVNTDTSASHEYLCTLIKNGREFCKLLIKRSQTVVFSNYVKMLYSSTNARKVYANQDDSVSAYANTD